ncbi:protein LYK5-like [Argentina anserina]|uniref:protein LYK5-like n=1 Tax=Argentina anserina TaxID=57926 RepID=UPI0021767ADC|nr:protein LYK5-like [Potentilla anserina]
MKMKMELMLLMVVSALLLLAAVVHGQQTYVANKQLDCYNDYNSTGGYLCNSVSSSCQSYLTFRSIDPLYNSPTSISYLLDSTPSAIASANNISDVDPIPADTPVLVPVNCSCSGNYSQHNSSYTLKTAADTYFGVANNTYQGLTTCQSLMHQNSYGDRNLTKGLVLQVPVRCACPTAVQVAAGVNYLLVYLVDWGDSIAAIAEQFGVDESALLAANDLSSTDIIYPFTPLLVPLKTKPTPQQLQLPTSPTPSPSPPSPPPPSGGSSNNKKWVFIGVGVGASCLLLLLIVLFFLSKRRHRQRRQSTKPNLKSSGDYTPSPLLPITTSNSDDTTKSWSAYSSSSGLKSAVESLTSYKFEDLQKATQFFSESGRINGSSVYRANFDGDEAAVKVMIGDVSPEVNILKRINHSNIIRLSGFCVHRGNTYLVYEFAPTGSLIDCLHKGAISTLSWKQRVQIANDVASALNYLHNFTEPPLIHKNLNTSNILLDANLRAKVANFGLARAVELDKVDEDGGEGFQQTRHVVGTRGYMAPEYIEGGVITPKLDVFGFGVVLLELLSGRPASGDKGEHTLLCESIAEVLEGDDVRNKLKGFIDPSLKGEYPLELAFSMAQLAKSCVAPQLNSRPTMAQASGTLAKILSSTLDWDPSDAEDLSDSRTLSFGR